jgi:DMSO/TMAO reductase YedYZ molybdopterin-dependent catalytic subunit
LAIVIVAAVVIAVQFIQPNANVLPDGAPPQWEVTISGDVEQEKSFSLDEISKMPLTTVVRKVDDQNVTYKGVTLYEFCNQTGVLWDAGPINVISKSGQQATLNIFQAWNSTVYPYFQDSNRIMLVFIKDSQWMTEQTGGPVQLVAPYFSEDYQIEHVSEVNVDLWTVSVSGLVGNPITVSSKNMSLIQEATIEGEFVPGGGGKRTSNWTGLSLSDMLQVTNISSRAHRILVVAIDGYSKSYTLQEMADAQMLVGYKENGAPILHDQGGPFRLFCLSDKYKWGQFWVKFVTEIVVY